MDNGQSGYTSNSPEVPGRSDSAAEDQCRRTVVVGGAAGVAGADMEARDEPAVRATTARRRAPSAKRRALFGFETIHTLRALCFQRAGVLTMPQGHATLDVGPAPAVAERFERLDRLLAA